MNKDCSVLSFLCIRNEYDEPTFQELQWHVDYRPIGYKTLTGFLERRKAPKHREHIQRLLERFGCGDAFRRMCILDALTFNPDRHYGNFGVLFNTETMESISMCPVFDNNRSLFPDLDQGQLEDPNWYLQKCKPMIGKDFLVTARGLLTPEIRTDLKNLQGFQFTSTTASQPHRDA